MGADRIRYRIIFRIEDESGFHQTSSRSSGTLWGVVQEINNLLEQGIEVIDVVKEHWTNEPLNQQEKDTIEMLTHGKVKLK